MDLAINAYRKALERNPQHPDVLYNLAQLEDDKQNVTVARGLYRKFVKVAPKRLEQQKRAAEERIREM